MGFGKKDGKDGEKVRAEKEEKEQAKKKKDDEVDTTTGPITAATVSGFTIGM
jgi:hypothetical protein